MLPDKKLRRYYLLEGSENKYQDDKIFHQLTSQFLVSVQIVLLCKLKPLYHFLYHMIQSNTHRKQKHPLALQIYVLKDRSISVEYIERCKAANYDALCLTIDVPVNGRRERDLRTGMTVPPKLTLKSYLNIASKFDWTLNYLTHPPTPSMVNIEHRLKDAANDISVMDFMNSQFDRTVTWKDAEWMIGQWDKAFAVKGILSVEDAKRAKDIGASAIMISNHGGRQLDGCPAPFEMLKEIRDAVGDSIEIIVDGGIRRGIHVIKALAM